MQFDFDGCVKLSSLKLTGDSIPIFSIFTHYHLIVFEFIQFGSVWLIWWSLGYCISVHHVSACLFNMSPQTGSEMNIWGIKLVSYFLVYVSSLFMLFMTVNDLSAVRIKSTVIMAASRVTDQRHNQTCLTSWLPRLTPDEDRSPI